MIYFNKYVSNTLAASSNQAIFIAGDADKIYTSRAYYKIFAEGEYNYSFLFSNMTDSTFGTKSHKNFVCSSWTMRSVRVGVCKECSTERMTEPEKMYPVTFGFAYEKTVMPGEFFASDEIKLRFDNGDYICIEISWHGRMIPYHHETLVPVFSLENGEWVPSAVIPAVNMIGCDRETERRIGFLGDSITQGIGTPANSYKHWNAMLAEKLGDKYSYWNLGIGFARASDAASDGAWLFKAKQNDIVFVCLGVNDILAGRGAQKIAKDIFNIISILNAHRIKVILQTVPPFDYDCRQTMVWENVNYIIKNIFADYVYAVFDNVIILVKEGRRNLSGYGAHPNAEGCALWGEALYEMVRRNF